MTESVVFIIDRSSSVQPYLEPYLKTINGILRNFSPNTLLTAAVFNECVHYLCINLPLHKIDRPVGPEDIRPTGLTAFYDNVSAIINRLIAFYENNRQKAPIVIILTDGDDTCSKRIKKQQMALQIAMAKARGWQFIFLGVTENSVHIGREIGCNTCILYNTTEKCFTEIPNVLGKLLSDRNIPDIDLDLRDLTEVLSNVKIN